MENEGPPLWEYVPVSDYRLPSEPVAHTARRGFVFFRGLFRRNAQAPNSPFKPDDQLRSLPDRDLENIAPAPQWRHAADSLSLEIEDWSAREKPDPPVLTFVGPPFTGREEILTTLAKQRNWRLLSPPSPEQILSGDETWLSARNGDETPWVFPALEKAFFRHVKGLHLIRRFLDHAYSGDSGRGIIGCNSWAWAFLNRLRQGRRAVTLTLQAFDQNRLAEIFRKSAEARGERRILFRQSDNGDHVLPPDTTETTIKMSNFLQLLAARSRGIFGVAWNIWCDSLKTEPDEVMAEKAREEERKTGHRTVWVTPWRQLKLPSLPPNAEQSIAFVLHCLLLHDGLPRPMLQHLLPMTESQILEVLLHLEDERLTSRTDSTWQVAPQGYPAVRRFLQTNNYWVDSF